MFVCHESVMDKRLQLSSRSFHNKINRRWIWGQCFKFARWQHPAVQHKARCDVHGTTGKISVSIVATVSGALQNVSNPSLYSF